MLGLFIYLIMVLLPVLIPLGWTAGHKLNELRNGRTAGKSAPAMARPIAAAAPA